MPRLRITFTKKPDGTVVSRYERADGTATWQRIDGPNAAFFALHDLTHYAVETVLGHQKGFYGLLVDGWNVTDFGTPWPHGPLPSDLDPSEHLVGLLDAERASGATWGADEFNAPLAAHQAAFTASHTPLLDEATLACLRATVRQLHARWLALPVGETLALAFPADATDGSAQPASLSAHMRKPAKSA